jgi:hypothetical protein
VKEEGSRLWRVFRRLFGTRAPARVPRPQPRVALPPGGECPILLVKPLTWEVRRNPDPAAIAAMTPDQRSECFMELANPFLSGGTFRSMGRWPGEPTPVDDGILGRMERLEKAGLDPDFHPVDQPALRPFMQVNHPRGEALACRLWAATDIAAWLAVQSPDPAHPGHDLPVYQSLLQALGREWWDLLSCMLKTPCVNDWLDQTPGVRARLFYGCINSDRPSPEGLRVLLDHGFDPATRLWLDGAHRPGSPLLVVLFGIERESRSYLASALPIPPPPLPGRKRKDSRTLARLQAIVDLLIDAGVDPDAPCGMERSPLAYAREHVPEMAFPMEVRHRMRSDRLALDALPEAAMPAAPSSRRRL